MWRNAPAAGTRFQLLAAHELGTELEAGGVVTSGLEAGASRLGDPTEEQAFGTGRRVLVVDDEELVCAVLGELLESDGFEVIVAHTVASTLEQLGNVSFDIIILDKNLPDGTGLDIAKHCKQAEIDAQIILITGFSSVRSAREAVDLGIFAYIEKPFPTMDSVRAHIKRAVKVRALEEDKRALVTELQTKNEALQAMLVRDPLTGLFNHAYLQDTLEREITRCGRKDDHLSVLFMDLDRFKEVNDTMGHGAGDRLLTLVADIVRGEARRSDLRFRLGPNDIAARYGGDEIALVLPETDKRGAAVMAERLRASIAEYDFISVGLTPQTVSIGVAAFPTDAGGRAALLEAADAALYSAKRAGRNRIAAFSPGMSIKRASDGAEAELDAKRFEALGRTIAGRDFDYVYQPIVTSRGGRVFAYEALCRPRDEAFPHPGVLIETAERAGRVGPLGRAMRQASVVALSDLPPDVQLFINIHPQELYDPEFNSIEPFMAQWAGRVVFEITEVAGIRDYTRVQEIIGGLRANGFKIALDDLGAGYSGLNSLALLQPDFVKLDMGLVRRLPDDLRAQRLVRHIIEFANDESMMVVAEGIETPIEHQVTRDLGCQLLQGYLFGKGVPISQIVES
jgi:diguanylate cyclase (GGDEF)-like protein